MVDDSTVGETCAGENQVLSAEDSVSPSRRKVLQGVGVSIAMPLAAGCLGDGDDANGDGDSDGDGDEDDLDAWFETTANWDGEIEDRTGEDQITVENGHSDEHGTYAFVPAAIEVDAGTTVEWEWIGEDNHSVTAENGEFDSGAVQEKGNVFEQTFDEEGEYRYKCVPHEALGQKGVVIVE